MGMATVYLAQHMKQGFLFWEEDRGLRHSVVIT